MPFFEPPPPPEPAREPAWSAPPAGVIGALALRDPVELAVTDEVAVVAERIVAYPNGFQIALVLLARTVEASWHLSGTQSPYPIPPRPAAGQALGDEFLRFGLQFSDGSKATNLDLLGGMRFDPFREEPDRPILLGGVGGGGGMRFEQSHWCWPLPPPGPMELVCEWPARGIGLTRRQLQAETIIEAASRARRLWPD
jgi:hypothetical protein